MTHTENAFVKVIKNKIAPEKGDVIKFDIYGDGELHRFKVLKDDGIICTLVSLDIKHITKYDSNVSGNITYNGSDLDLVLNDLYYNERFSTKVKNSIIPIDKVQTIYSEGTLWQTDDYFIIKAKNTPELYTRYRYDKHDSIVSTNKYCWALDLDDLREYFNIKTGDIVDSEIIYNFAHELGIYLDDSQTNGMWLSTVYQGSSSRLNHAFRLIDNYAGISGTFHSNNNYAIPAFKIDLTDINYEIEK